MGFCVDLWESFWRALENGSFKGYARGCAVLNVLLLFAVPLLCFITLKPLPIATMVLLFIFSVILGVLELPFCCMWFSQCRTLAGFMRIFEVYWIRAILYLGLAATLISVAIHVDSNNAATWYFGLILTIIAILYLLASCKGEKSSLEEAAYTSANKDPNAVKDPNALESGVNREAAKSETQAPSSAHEIAMDIARDEGVQKAAVNVASKNPDLLRDALRAAAGSRL
jgi:hypothetical protein